MSLLEKLGQDPQHSLTVFIRGLGLFCCGALFVTLGYYQHHYWQILGLGFIAIGCIIAAWGYIGMFANRLYHSFNHRKQK
jgi:hypothetical protein